MISHLHNPAYLHHQPSHCPPVSFCELFPSKERLYDLSRVFFRIEQLPNWRRDNEIYAFAPMATPKVPQATLHRVTTAARLKEEADAAADLPAAGESKHATEEGDGSAGTGAARDFNGDNLHPLTLDTGGEQVTSGVENSIAGPLRLFGPPKEAPPPVGVAALRGVHIRKQEQLTDRASAPAASTDDLPDQGAWDETPYRSATSVSPAVSMDVTKESMRRADSVAAIRQQHADQVRAIEEERNLIAARAEADRAIATKRRKDDLARIQAERREANSAQAAQERAEALEEHHRRIARLAFAGIELVLAAGDGPGHIAVEET